MAKKKNGSVRRVICKNWLCKYNHNGTHTCCYDGDLTFDEKCENFAPGMVYYTNLVWNLLDKGNFITDFSLTDDLRIGLFLVMEIWDLEFSYGRGIIQLVKEGYNDGKALTYRDISTLPINNEKLEKYWKMFLTDEGKEYFQNKLETNRIKKEQEENEEIPEPEYGWLDPSGNFYPSEWGTHVAKAYEICDKFKYEIGYDENGNFMTAGDYLINKRNWILIDNPNKAFYIHVTYGNRISKAQREFMYDYFIKLKQPDRAKEFIVEEEP